VNDITRPVKRIVASAWHPMEARIQAAVCKRFGLPVEQPEDVTYADTLLASTEMRDLMPVPRPDWEGRIPPLAGLIAPWSSSVAHGAFLHRFLDLYNR
jgi:uncharacterized protein